MASNRIEVRRVEASHLPMVAAFYRAAWSTGNDDQTEPHVLPSSEWFERAPAVLAIQDSRVIGYLGTLPMRLWRTDREVDAHWFKGFMVVPEFRNGPIGFALVREAMKHVNNVTVLTVQPASWRLFQAAGLAHLGTVPNYLRVLRPARVARQVDLARLPLGRFPGWVLRGARLAQRTGLAGVGGALGGAAADAFAAVRGRGDDVVASASIDDTDSELKDTWNRMRSSVRLGQARDAEYVRTRYGAASDPLFTRSHIRGRAGSAFTMVRRPRADADERLSGLSVAVLSDIIAPLDEPGLMCAAVRRAEEDARALGADALVCSASHGSIESALKRRAWIRIPANLEFLARFEDGSSTTLNDWWLMRADGNSDEGF